MAWLLTLTLGCISLYLQLPCVLSGLVGRDPPSTPPRQPPAWTLSSDLLPRQPALQPMFRKLRQAPKLQRSVSPPPTTGRPLKHGDSHHARRQRHLVPQRLLGPRRPQAQLLRVGCVLGTCQVQNLSHRLWQLVGPAGRRNSAPVDPNSPHSYG
ncbi:protein ADM2 [Thomomys bottae]